LDHIAKEIGVGKIWYKDEGSRFGLKSFKALGGAYAIQQLLRNHLQDQLGVLPSAVELLEGRFRKQTANLTVTCATDGNHGRSVAWGANLFGCRAVIYIHEHVSEARAQAIKEFGAQIVRCNGTYDDSVRQAAADAALRGWLVVSDTSYEGYRDVPRDVMQGYTVLVDEALAEIGDQREITHTFVQAGVGGFAAAVCGHLWETFEDKRPRFVVVEPEQAACIFESIKAEHPVAFGGTLETIMAGLACGEPSLLAWDILAEGADDALTITDAQAADCMRRLARGSGGDPKVVAGESAVAGLAGLIASAVDTDLRQALCLDHSSNVLVFGTEADTDPAAYLAIVGGQGVAR
jgi:diaminopropionate ammonia-lyase